MECQIKVNVFLKAAEKWKRMQLIKTGKRRRITAHSLINAGNDGSGGGGGGGGGLWAQPFWSYEITVT